MSNPEEGAGDAAGDAAPAPVTVSHAVGLHGAAVAFDPAQENWSEYVERLQHYFTANDIVSDEKRKVILLNAVGPSTYRLIRTLVSPSKVTDFTFKQIVEKAQAHFSPKPSHSKAVRVQYQETRGRRVHSHVRSGTTEDRRTLRVWTCVERHASRPSRLWDKQQSNPAQVTTGERPQLGESPTSGLVNGSCRCGLQEVDKQGW